MAAALATATRFYAAMVASYFAGVTTCFAADCPTVTPAGSMNPTEHKAFGRAFKAALPDAHMEIEKAVEAGSEVFIAGRFRSTHTGDLATQQGTLPASGTPLDLPYADYFRVEGGQIVEHRVYSDQVEMMAQFGASPQ